MCGEVQLFSKIRCSGKNRTPKSTNNGPSRIQLACSYKKSHNSTKAQAQLLVLYYLKENYCNLKLVQCRKSNMTSFKYRFFPSAKRCCIVGLASEQKPPTFKLLQHFLEHLARKHATGETLVNAEIKCFV